MQALHHGWLVSRFFHWMAHWMRRLAERLDGPPAMEETGHEGPAHWVAMLKARAPHLLTPGAMTDSWLGDAPAAFSPRPTAKTSPQRPQEMSTEPVPVPEAEISVKSLLRKKAAFFSKIEIPRVTEANEKTIAAPSIPSLKSPPRTLQLTRISREKIPSTPDLRGAHAPSRVVFGALAEDRGCARSESRSGDEQFPAGAPETTREGACAPHKPQNPSSPPLHPSLPSASIRVHPRLKNSSSRVAPSHDLPSSVVAVSCSNIIEAATPSHTSSRTLSKSPPSPERDSDLKHVPRSEKHPRDAAAHFPTLFETTFSARETAVSEPAIFPSLSSRGQWPDLPEAPALSSAPSTDIAERVRLLECTQRDQPWTEFAF